MSPQLGSRLVAWEYNVVAFASSNDRSMDRICMLGVKAVATE